MFYSMDTLISVIHLLFTELQISWRDVYNNVKTPLLRDIIVRSYNKSPNCCPFTQTQAR